MTGETYCVHQLEDNIEKRAIPPKFIYILRQFLPNPNKVFLDINKLILKFGKRFDFK